MKFKHEMVVCIVNNGYSEAVMKSAREVGAKGGTVISAKGTANPDAEKFFNITIEPEKEMVIIVVPAQIKADLMQALYKEVGLDTPGQGIAFSLPIDGVIGIAEQNDKREEK